MAKSLVLNGSSQYLTVTNFLDNPTVLTAVVVFKTSENTSGRHQALVGKGENWSGKNAWYHYLSPMTLNGTVQQPRGQVEDPAHDYLNSNGVNDSNHVVNDGNWHSAIMEWDKANSFSLVEFRDLADITSVDGNWASGNTVANGYSVTIGACGDGSRLFNGKLFHVSLWSKVLNSTERANAIQNIVDTNDSALEFWCDFNDNLTDQSAHGRTITATGSPSFATDAPVYGSTSSSVSSSPSSSASHSPSGSPSTSVSSSPSSSASSSASSPSEPTLKEQMQANLDEMQELINQLP